VSRWLAANASAMRRGNPRAAVEIIELSEFQCPACANAHSKIEPIIQANLSRINYARIDLPLFEHHEWAVPGTLAARALQRVAPLRYWDFVTETFKNQETIGAAPFERHFQQFAARHGLDWAALQKVYNSASERAAVLEQVSRVFQMGIASTPTYIINGRIMGFGPEGSFTLAAIKAALAAAP
jgi:protein-disulfide isomerase